MNDSYNKINDYTLEVVQNLSEREPALGSYSYNIHADYSLTRIFNFGTGQITTLARHFAGVAGRQAHVHGAGVASSMQMQVQDFRDLPSLHEVTLMHQKLQEMDGNPPPLEGLIQRPPAPVNGKASLRMPRS